MKKTDQDYKKNKAAYENVKKNLAVLEVSVVISVNKLKVCAVFVRLDRFNLYLLLCKNT